MRSFWVVLLLMLFFLLVLVLLIPRVTAQGSTYSAGNVLTFVATFPATCADGNLIILSAPVGEFEAGTLHRCVNKVFTPLLPIPPKTILNLPNNTFADVLTVSVPNAASAAVLEISLSGSLGAGGAIGPYESSIGANALITITRVPGQATVKNLMIQPAPDVRSVGAAAITQDISLSANVGATNATQTFAVQYKVARGTGNSTNHVASATSRVVSPALSLITVN